MKRWFIIFALFVLPAWMVAPGYAQLTSEQELILERLRNAEAELQAAQTKLNEARNQANPVLARYSQMKQRYDELTAQLNTAMDEVTRTRNQVQKLPISLTARRDALMDSLTRLYRTQNGDSEQIREREAQLKDIEAQIARLEAAGAGSQTAYDEAYENMQRIARQKDRLYYQMQQVSLIEAQARGALTGSERRVRNAQEQLEIFRNLVRSEFSRAEPPHLAMVRIGSEASAVYQGTWKEPAKETEDLLRLAQYLQADLARSIPMRQASVDRLLDLVQSDMTKADQAMQAYVNAIGGSNDGWLGYVERGLDAVTFGYGGALVTSGYLTRQKITVELGDAAITVLRDAFVGDKKGRWPVHVALMVEAAYQVNDALTRDGPKNPDWDITKMMPSSRGGHVPVSAEDEQKLLNAVNAASIRSGLDRMYTVVDKDKLRNEDFRDALLREHGGAHLAAAFSQTIVLRNRPRLKALEHRDMLGKPIKTWAWDFMLSSSGFSKTTFKDIVGSVVLGEKPGILKANLLDALQSAVKDGLLEQIERERLIIWSRYLEADAELQVSVAMLRNEGRLKRMDERLQKILTDEVIPQLTRELETQRPQREQVITSSPVTGRSVEVHLEFSQPVIVSSVKLGDQDLEFSGNNTVWKAKIDLRDFDVDKARLHVEAAQVGYEDRLLDDPKTIASYSVQQSQYVGYEPKADENHELQLKPPEGDGFVIVLDTSSSMDENDRIGKAKLALAEVFDNGRIEAGDIVGVVNYRGSCATPFLVDYTEDLDAVKTAIQGARTDPQAGTPLALSILNAAKSLRDQNFERATLVVVTDGEDSCQGDLSSALSEARTIVDRIRDRRVR